MILINSITGNPLTITDSNDNVTHYIFRPKGIVAQLNESLTYFLHKDHLRFTRVVMNENNQAISSYDYNVWGNPMNSTVSEESTYRNTGREYDEETGLHNFRARIYDSTLMRFYQVDPAEQFASPYVYCGNNPIGLVDPDGRVVKPIGAKKSKEEFIEYMNNSNLMLEYSLNDRGLMYQSGSGIGPLVEEEVFLQTAMEDQSIRVNVFIDNDGLIANRDVIAGGANGGNHRDWWPFNKIKRIADVYVHFPSAQAYNDVGGCDVGRTIAHESGEGYIGATDKAFYGAYSSDKRNITHAIMTSKESDQYYPVLSKTIQTLQDNKRKGPNHFRELRLFWELNGKTTSWDIKKWGEDD